MKKNPATTAEGKVCGRIAKLENKVRRAEEKLAAAETKLEKRRTKLAAAREAYEAALAASAETEQQAGSCCAAETNGDGQAGDDSDD